MRTRTGTVADDAKIVRNETIDNAPQESPDGYAGGERLRVTKGDLVAQDDAQMKAPSRTVAGTEVEALGECYVSAAGPNRDKVMQQVRDVRTGELMAVSVSQMRRQQGERGSSRPAVVITRPVSRDESPAAVAAREERWTEVRPGVRRLARES